MNIVVTGSIAYDYLMRFPGQFSENILPESLHQVSLSFLADDMAKHWGGVAANIAFTMAKLNLHPSLMGTVGRDFGEYRRWLDDAGVDTSTVKQIDEVFTASFFCNTDNVNNQIAFFYTGAMAYARDYQLADAVNGTAPDLVIVSPNDPLAMSRLTEECRQRNYRFVYDPSQQVPRLSGDDLSKDMQGAYAMVVNAYEADVICEKTGMSLQDLRDTIDLLVITHGENGSKIYTNGDIIEVPAIAPDTILDPTGAGDAYRAGFFTGLMRGMSLGTAGQVGALSAAYALENIGTQNHHFTIQDFVDRLRSHVDDGGELDKLLA